MKITKLLVFASTLWASCLLALTCSTLDNLNITAIGAKYSGTLTPPLILLATGLFALRAPTSINLVLLWAHPTVAMSSVGVANVVDLTGSFVKNGLFGNAAAAGGGGDPPKPPNGNNNIPLSRGKNVSIPSAYRAHIGFSTRGGC